MPRRIALMIESDGPGGAESVILTLADGLRTAGHQVFPVVLSGGPGWLSGRLQKAGFPLFLPYLRNSLDPIFIWGLVQWIKSQRIDLLHGHEFTMGFLAGVAGGLAGIPHVITMHGGKYFDTARHRRKMLRFSAMRAAHVIGVSEPTCRHLADSLGLPRERIDLVPNGVRAERGERARVRRELGIGDDVRLLVAVGNLYKVKDHQTMIRALAMLDQFDALPPWKAVIAGRGEEEQPLRALIRDFSLDDRVLLLGLRSDIPDLLAAADGWLMSSLSEGLPMALLEAMFASVPVISTSVGGIPTLVRPGESGWLVPPGMPEELGHAIADLLRDASRAQRLGRRGREIAETGFGQEKLIAAHMDLYRSASRR